MGTNIYIRRKVPRMVPVYDSTHIAKLSWGWRAHFDGSSMAREFHAVSKSYVNHDLDWVKLNVDSIAIEQLAELVEDHSECKECFATGLTYRRCKYSVNRGWRDSQCRNIAPKNYIDFLCSECHFVHYHNDEIDSGDDNDWEFCPKCGRSVKR